MDESRNNRIIANCETGLSEKTCLLCVCCLQYLEALKQQIREQLRLLAHAPSVQMQDVPPPTVDIESLIREQHDAEADGQATASAPGPASALAAANRPRLISSAEHLAEFYDGDRDHDNPNAPSASAPAATPSASAFSAAASASGTTTTHPST